MILAIIYNSSSTADLNKTKTELKQFGVKFKLYKCDLKDLSKLKTTINKIGSDFNKIDLLVNNSGVIKKIEFTDITPKLFDDTIAVNLRAPLFVSQFALKYLSKAKEPLIINIASLGGMQKLDGINPIQHIKNGTD
jgi:short-subunit dehydrogenase